jgi:hypothetical protein
MKLGFVGSSLTLDPTYGIKPFPPGCFSTI